MNTSPRTVIVTFSVSSFGIFFIVFKFSVTSSPTSPFPLVEPLTNIPSLYSNDAVNPSIFVSTTKFLFSILFSSACFCILFT